MSRSILPSELQNRSLGELWNLYAETERELAQCPIGSFAHRQALASLDKIRRAIAARVCRPDGPAPRL